MAAQWIELGLIALCVGYLVLRWLAFQRDPTGQWMRDECRQVTDFSLHLYSSKRAQCAHLDE